MVASDLRASETRTTRRQLENAQLANGSRGILSRMRPRQQVVLTCDGTIGGTKRTDTHVAAAGPIGSANQPECAQTAAECAISTIAARRFTRERSQVQTPPRPFP